MMSPETGTYKFWMENGRDVRDVFFRIVDSEGETRFAGRAGSQSLAQRLKSHWRNANGGEGGGFGRILSENAPAFWDWTVVIYPRDNGAGAARPNAHRAESPAGDWGSPRKRYSEREAKAAVAAMERMLADRDKRKPLSDEEFAALFPR